MMLVVPEPTPVILPLMSTMATFVFAEEKTRAWLVFPERLIELPDCWPSTVEATLTPLEMGDGNCSERFVYVLMPLALSRRIESELAGNVRIKLVPALEMELVTGETKVGAAKEFSSEALPEVSWTTVPL